MKCISDSVFLIVLYFLLLYGGCTNPSNTASKSHKASIGVRNAHMMAYHVAEDKVYLFGGADEQQVRSDTWCMEDTIWVEVPTATSPPARTFGSMVYDPVAKRMILHGGSRVLFGQKLDVANVLDDTWQLAKGTWSRIPCERSPSPRAEASMVYDDAHQRIVLFGGYTIVDDAIVKLADTWIFEQGRWRELEIDGPTARHGVTLVYDPGNEVVVLFGGSTVDRQYGSDQGQTWFLEGDMWKQQINSPMKGLFNAASAYDHDRQAIVLFGGWDGSHRAHATYQFIAQSWSAVSTTKSPSARNHSQMVYDLKHNQMVLFGGHDGSNVFGDTWLYKQGDWEQMHPVTPKARLENGH